MLTEEKIGYFLKKIEEEIANLSDYKPDTWLYNLEAYITLAQLKGTLARKPISRYLSNELQSILKARWTNIEYLHDFTNPANKVCIEIARELGVLLGTSYLIVLMPNLAETKEADYITSSYNDEIELYDIVLSDCGKRIISISDVLSSAQNDGILKHNSLFGGRAKALSNFEIRKVLSRHSTVKELYDAIEARTSFKFEGDTVGAALNRLIAGLRAGGVTVGRKLRKKGSGDDYDSGYDANTAIVEFSEYLETLSPETLAILMQAKIIDRFRHGAEVELKLMSDIWGKIARPKDVTYRESRYCVELAAIDLEEILRENPGLFDLVSYEGDAVESLAKLEETVVKSHDAMVSQLKRIDKHAFYDDRRNRHLSLVLYELVPGFILRAEDIAFIADNYVALISHGPDFSITVASNMLLLSIAKKYSPSMIKSAMDLMSAEGRKKFIEKSGGKESTLANRFFVPALATAEEPQASRKRRADEAGMAPNSMAS